MEYEDSNFLNKELSLILKNSIQHYIKERTDFDYKNGNDYIYQIVKNKQIIGNFYKYKEGFDYTKIGIKYFYNKQLINSIYISANEIYLQNKINYSNNDSNSKEEEFYLVKKQYFSELKKENNYKQLKQYLKGKIKNIPTSDKEIENIIESFSKNDLNIINNMKQQTNQKKDDPTSYEIDIIPIFNPNNQSEFFMVCQDFKLFEKNVLKIY